MIINYHISNTKIRAVRKINTYFLLYQYLCNTAKVKSSKIYINKMKLNVFN